MEKWFARNYPNFRQKIPSRLRPIVNRAAKTTTEQFALAVLIEFLFLVFATLLAAEEIDYYLFLGVNIIMFLHVFMHISQSLYLKKLVPGVVTAVFFILPYSIYVFYQLIAETKVNWSDLFISLPLGFLLIPIVLFGHYLGSKLLK